ncbi:MAG TPA: subclass B1 metallo-beta-lactamase [Gammaproteobacteria bacterium]
MNMLRGLARPFMLIAIAAAVALSACATPPEKPDPADYRQTMQMLNQKRAIQPDVVLNDLHIFTVSDNLHVYRSYFDLGSQRLHANGMLMIGTDRITIIDAPWTAAAAYELLDWLDSNFPGKVKRLVITHAHDDRMGSIDVFAERGIPIYSQRNTAQIARKKGWTAPNFVFDGNLPLRSGEQAVELFYPGPAHALDNIIAWFPDDKVLFGGCMVKSRHAETLGFTGDANEQSWPLALRRALARYPEAQQVIPGHGLPGDAQLLTHTIELLED